LHEELDPSHPGPDLVTHLASCSECQQVQGKLVAMREAMRQVPLPSLPDGFELALRRELTREAVELDREAASRRRARRPSRAPLVMSAAAALLLVLSGILIWFATRAPEESAPGYHRLRLSIRAVQDHPDALLDVDLPAGVRLAPRAVTALGSDRSLRWRSHLRQGVNTFDLPLVVDKQPSAEIRARLIVAGRTMDRWLRLPPPEGHARASAPRTVQLAWLVDDGRAR
jgi:hypothetical protein